jgi:branched-chain amino acid transport system permease protein
MGALLGQLALDGVAMGMVYVLLTAGIVFIVSVSGVFLFAYGQFYMIGAFLIWACMTSLHLPFFLSLIIGVLATGLLGALSYQFIFKYTRVAERSFLATITAATGLMLVMGQSGMLIFGTVARGIPTVFPGMLQFFGMRFTMDKLVLTLLAIAVTMALFLLQAKTRVGRAMQAVSCLSETASLQGINTNLICLSSVGIGCAIAGFAGGIMAPSYGINPQMGNNIILIVMLIAMLGGMTSLPGAVLGGLVVGMILSFGQYYIGSGVQIYLFLIVGIIIYFKPAGLMGKRGEDFGL